MLSLKPVKHSCLQAQSRVHARHQKASGIRLSSPLFDRNPVWTRIRAGEQPEGPEETPAEPQKEEADANSPRYIDELKPLERKPLSKGMQEKLRNEYIGLGGAENATMGTNWFLLSLSSSPYWHSSRRSLGPSSGDSILRWTLGFLNSTTIDHDWWLDLRDSVVLLGDSPNSRR